MRGELAPGDKVPSQNELIDGGASAKATVNKAVALLKSWGMVETRVGSATRIAPLHKGVPISGPQDHTSRMLRGVPLYTEGERSEVYEASVISTRNVSDAVLQAAGSVSPGPARSRARPPRSSSAPARCTAASASPASAPRGSLTRSSSSRAPAVTRWPTG